MIMPWRLKWQSHLFRYKGAQMPGITSAQPDGPLLVQLPCNYHQAYVIKIAEIWMAIHKLDNIDTCHH